MPNSDKPESFGDAVARMSQEPKEVWIKRIKNTIHGPAKPVLKLVKAPSSETTQEPEHE